MAILGLIHGMFEVPIIKLDLHIWRSIISDYYCVGVRIEPTFMIAYSFSFKKTSLNSLTASVLTFTLSFKDPC
jgi:hypothetical protein